MGIKGIIFDMDNTLLRSKIDYDAMKRATYQFLVHNSIIRSDVLLTEHTTGTLIVEALKTNKMSDSLVKQMWDIAAYYETKGMQNVDLEPGVLELLELLHGKYHLTIFTNNSITAAEVALQNNRIIHFFEHIVGREHVQEVKPSPEGVHYILSQYDQYAPNNWISVGDSWIDGKAAAEANVSFISYHGDIEKMNKNGVYPEAELKHISQLVDCL